ncbi:MAG: dienelactone hydrolase [Candidatus Aldehydirespiratoraceae bacterium]|jgi:dienelactone hydrolase
MSRRMRGIGAVVLGLAVAASGLLIYVDEQHTYDVKTENFRFESGGNELAATLTLPTNGDALGVIVFIHGDGPADAANHDIGYRPMWEAIADAGWASVSWDKPGVGGSSGNWLAQTMEDRATEGVDVVASLADHPGIDANRVGLIGFSQAGWVLPLVANTVPVEFVIAGSPAINWLDQGRYLTNSQLSDNNASEDIRHSVNEANQTGLSVLEPDATYEEYLEWHEQLDPTIVPYLGEMSAERWQFVANNYRADATDGLASMVDTPVLLLLAGQDANVDVTDTEMGYRRLLSEACLQVETYPEAQHSLTDANGIGLMLAGTFAPRSIFADGLLSDISTYVTAHNDC